MVGPQRGQSKSFQNGLDKAHRVDIFVGAANGPILEEWKSGVCQANSIGGSFDEGKIVARDREVDSRIGRERRRRSNRDHEQRCGDVVALWAPAMHG